MTKTNDTNPFSLLGLAQRFDIDEDAIERAYLQRVTQLHPDMGGEAADFDTAELNQARQILLDDEQRANLILDLINGPTASQCKELPDGFLMDMMVRREEIEEHIQSGGQESRENWESWARQERAAYAQAVRELFDSIPTEQSQDEQSISDDQRSTTLVEIRTQLNAWRYIERLIEQLDPDYDPAHADFR